MKKNNKDMKKKVLFAVSIFAWVLGGMLAAMYIAKLLLVLLAAIFPVVIDFCNAAAGQTIVSALVYVFCAVVVLGVPVFIMKKKDNLKNLFGFIGLPTWTDILLAPIFYILSSILGIAAIAIVGAIFPWLNLDEAQELGYEQISSTSDLIMAGVGLVIVAPIAEELIFRGWMYGKLRTKIVAWPAIILTSLAFAIAHLQLNVGIVVFFMSVGQCLQREITGTTWSSLLTHMIRNGFAFYLLFVYPMIGLI